MQVREDNVKVIDKPEAPGYRMCTRTVLDTTVPGITFDEYGESNFCQYYDALAKRTVLRDPAVLQREFNDSIEAIRQAGRGKAYDCILGVSG
ncbi:MAG TPA: hypothetical protein VD816_06760, partial [Ohtaekwangia sp.]|nr:hypothetical protein [Ohtaekwangia sp.]